MWSLAFSFAPAASNAFTAPTWPLGCRPVKGSRPSVVFGVDVRAGSEQGLHHSRMATVCRPVKGSFPIFGFGVHVRAGSEQLPDAKLIALARYVVDRGRHHRW